MKRIVLIGAGGHAKTVVDTIELLNEYEIAGFIDDIPVGTIVYRGYKVIGNDNDARAIYSSGVDKAFISIGFIGNSDIRSKLFSHYKSIGFEFPSVIEPTAYVAKDATIGQGTYVGRDAVINVDAVVGDNCIINTAAIIEHECKVGSFSHIACGTVLCGQVSVGTNTFVGANATIIQCLSIGNDCIIGAGTVVRKNITDSKTVVNLDRVVELN